jgi:hypothetical protein
VQAGGTAPAIFRRQWPALNMEGWEIDGEVWRRLFGTFFTSVTNVPFAWTSRVGFLLIVSMFCQESFILSPSVYALPELFSFFSGRARFSLPSLTAIFRTNFSRPFACRFFEVHVFTPGSLLCRFSVANVSTSFSCPLHIDG